MASHRNIALGSAAVLAVAALTLAGSSLGYAASPTHTTTAAHPQVSGGPNPYAPHVATHVVGAQYGTHLSIDNPSSLHAFKVLHQQLLGHQSRQPDTIHEYVGTSFDSSDMGSQATQSVSTKIKPRDPGTTLYTPTMYPSGGSSAGSCIEISTAYFHTSQVVAAWDWCQAITFVAEAKIDASFMKTYTSHQNYTVQIVQTDSSNNTWTAYLYNYKTAKWDTFYSQSGTSQVGLSDGWDLYELYSNINPKGHSYACRDLRNKRVEAKKILVDVGGTFVRANPSNAGHEYDVPLSAFQCPSLTYNMIKDYSHWKAIG